MTEARTGWFLIKHPDWDHILLGVDNDQILAFYNFCYEGREYLNEYNFQPLEISVIKEIIEYIQANELLYLIDTISINQRDPTFSSLHNVFPEIQRHIEQQLLDKPTYVPGLFLLGSDTSRRIPNADRRMICQQQYLDWIKDSLVFYPGGIPRYPLPLEDLALILDQFYE